MVKKRKGGDGDIVKARKPPGALSKKRKAADALGGDVAPRANNRVRNRASPIAIVKLYEFMNDSTIGAVVKMEMQSLLDIKCHFLNYHVIKWFAGAYDKHSREFVIPGRGRIPLNSDSVYRTLGLPRGSEPVVYAMDAEIESSLAPVLFPADCSVPLTSRVFEILKGMKVGDKAYKQILIMYIVSTVLAPSTSTQCRNRCYPVMVSFTPPSIFVFA